VLYQRHVFDKVGTFSTQLRACEDYDMYLRVAREFPVATHEELVAEYRMHGSNMSGDLALMLRSVTRVLNLQLPYIRHDVARMNAYREGLEGWREHYTPKMLDQIGILRQTAAGRRKLPRLILTYLQLAPSTLTRLGLEEGKVKLRSKLRKAIPDAIRRAVRPKEDPGEVPFGRVNFGDLRRLTPISRHYGFDRGLPIDRHYIERFLGAHSGAIKGRVLEVGGNDYTVRFGGKQVSQADVLHVQEGNPQATFVGDLATADHLPDNAFDCVVLTQTLHLIYDVPAALATLHRILKPGGVLLMTVPGTISQIEQGDWTNYWHWGFTERSIRKLCEAQFPAPEVNVEVHGNVLTSIAFLHGVAAGELTAPELDARDPLYPLLITIHARKASPR
jgi:hypothetical protein